jgi:CRISPR-associated endonuclease/helicase Cas3
LRLSAPARHGLEALDSGWAEQWHRLLDRYGLWGLAWLEAILRLADQQVSAEESA